MLTKMKVALAIPMAFAIRMALAIPMALAIAMAFAIAIVLGTGSATLAASDHRDASRPGHALERPAAMAAFGYRANRLETTADDPHYWDTQPGGMLAR
jgi:hypothetical protein